MSKASRQSSSFWKLHRQGAHLNKAVFRATKGRFGASFRGSPVLLLDHVGRTSGRARTNPLIYLDDAPNLVIVASKGGADTHPSWFHNLMAMPATEVELPGGIGRRVRPRLATGAERDALWARLVAVYEPYAAYATYTHREIPIIILEPDNLETDDLSATQRAVHQRGYGDVANVLVPSTTQPITAPSSIQVQIQVHAASINPIDWQMIEGNRRLLVSRSFPFVPLFDLSGVVVAAGRAVTRLKIGDRVHADNKKDGGGASEFVNVEQDLVSTMPARLSFAEAAAIPLAAQTALIALEKAQVGHGSHLCIIGASGGVGSFAVQIAKALGAAHITAVCSARNNSFVRSLGADAVIDYTSDRIDQSITQGSLDAVIDCVGGRDKWEAAQVVLATNGKFVTISRDDDDRVTMTSALKQSSTILARKIRSFIGRRIDYLPVFLDASHTILDRVDHMVEAGHIRVHVDQSYDFSLNGIVTALQQSKSGRTVGKAVVEIIKDPTETPAQAPAPAGV